MEAAGTADMKRNKLCYRTWLVVPDSYRRCIVCLALACSFRRHLRLQHRSVDALTKCFWPSMHSDHTLDQTLLSTLAVIASEMCRR